MNKILVLDFGGQYAHLIARRFRNLGYYSEIALPDIDEKKITNNVKGIVLSGGPSSVYDKSAPQFNNNILSLDIPILGLCYGHQLLLKKYDGIVEKARVGEFGYTILNKIKNSPLFNSVSFPAQVWMSHSDSVINIPDGFEVIGSTKDCINACVQNLSLKRFSLQFHAEVKDTPAGNIIFNNFAKLCRMRKNWDSSRVLSTLKKRIIIEAKNKKVLLFLSGGVDSSVAFALLISALGKDKVLGLYVNNGFMRENETQIIISRYQEAGFKNIIVEDGETKFLNALHHITDPQQKRKIIGETFLQVRDDVVKKLGLTEDEWLLAQGTLYPDIIESGGTKHARVIKTHHNRVDGIKQLLKKGLIIEPLKDLYKDEVRIIGKKIGLLDDIINRHPFPGPGISINLLCSDGNISDEELFIQTNDKLKNLNILKYLKGEAYKLYALPVKSVGVQGDFRTYNFPVVLKLENVLDNFIGWDKLEKISSFITNNIKNVNRVILQIFKKRECSLIEAYCTKDRLDMIN